MEEVADVEDELDELESEAAAANRSCINWPRACIGFSVELAEEVELLVEVLFELESLVVLPSEPDAPDEGGGGGIESPIWSSVCMMLDIRVSSPPDCDVVPETWLLDESELLLDWPSRERYSV